MPNTKLPATNDFVTMGQATKMLGVHHTTLRRWDLAGKITTKRLDGKNRYFSLADLTRLKEEKPLSISQAAEKLHVSVSTLRRMDKKGLLAAERNERGERVYEKSLHKKTADSATPFATTASSFQKTAQPVMKNPVYTNNYAWTRQKTFTGNQPQTPLRPARFAQLSRENRSMESILKNAYSNAGVFESLPAKPFAAPVYPQTMPDAAAKQIKMHPSLSPLSFVASRMVLGFLLFLLVTPMVAFGVLSFGDVRNKLAMSQPRSSVADDEKVTLADVFGTDEDAITKAVLAASTSKQTGTFVVKIPTLIDQNATVSGNLTAPNILYSVIAGTGIGITAGQTPTISNTGVLSVGGSTGAVTFTGGTGISVTGTTITSTGVTSVNSLNGALKIVGGGINTVGASGTTVTVTGTEADTLATVTGRGATTSTALTLNGAVSMGSTLSVTGTSQFTGNVGIGTTNATQLLHIQDGAIYISSNVPSSTSYSLYNNDATLMWNGNSVAIGGSISGTAGRIAYFTTTNSVGDSAMFQDSGNIGVGTTAPVNKFVVIDTTTPQMRVGYDNTTNYYTTAVSSAGAVTFDANGASSGFTFSDLITATSGLTATTGDITATAGNVAITAGVLTLGGTTRISNAGVGTFITGTVIGSQTFTTNNIADSGALTIAAGATGLNLQPDGTIDVNIAGGSGATGCTIANTTGNLTCTGNITGGSTGTQGYWQRALGALSPTNITDDVLLGGTATSSALIKLGGTTNADSYFNTGGNVGIGTTAPVGTLHVLGTTNTQAGILVDVNTANDLFTASASGVNKFVIKNDGNVGIGTTNPARHLTLYNINAPILQFTTSSTGTAAGDGLLIQESGIDTYIENTEIGGNMYFRTEATNRLTINNNGNVGIGTTAPVGTLNVHGTINTQAGIIVNVTTLNDIFTASLSGVPKFTIKNDGTVNIQSLSASSGVYTDANKNLTSTIPTSGMVGYWQRALGALSPTNITDDVLLGGTATSSALIKLGGTTNADSYFNTGGNVGIGTTAPLNKLDIQTVARSGTHATGAPLYVTADLGQASSGIEFRHSNGTEGIGFGYEGIYATGSTTNQNLSILPRGTGSLFIGATNGYSALLSVGSSTSTAAQNIAINSAADQQVSLIFSSANSLKWQFYRPASSTDLRLWDTTDRVTFQTGGNVGIGTTAPVGTLNVHGTINTQAGIIVNVTTLNDIFTASLSGVPKFTIKNDGTVNIQSLSASSGVYTDANKNLTSTIPTSGTVGYWQRALGALSPTNITDDVLLGGTATSSALIKLGGTTNADSYFNTGGNVGIGTTAPVGTLHVLGTTNTQAGILVDVNTANDLFTASASGVNKFVIKNDGNVGIGTTAPGYRLSVQGADTGVGGGEHFISQLLGAAGAEMLLGYTANGSTVDSILFRAANSKAITFGTTSTNNAMTILNGGNVGIGTTSPGAQLDLSTDSARKLTTTTWATGSDSRIKTQIESISDALDIIGRVRPVKFHYTDAYMTAHPSIVDTDYYNFIAQEYQQVFPNSVNEVDGLLYLNSSNMIPYAIAGIKEQQQQIEEIRSIYSLDANGNVVIPNLVTNKLTVSGALDIKTSAVSTPPTPDLTNLQTALNQLASQNNNLDTIAASLSARVAFLEQTVSTAVLGASTSASLTSMSDLLANNATISGELTVAGRAIVGDLGVTGNILTGVMSIHGLDGEINTLAGDLKLQSKGMNGIDLLAGKVTIDTSGNITTEGEITAKKINIDTTDVLSASLGTGTLPSGDTQVTIPTTAVTANSKIFVTATKKTGSQPLIVSQKNTGSGFVVSIENTYGGDIKFDWWIVN